jgi:hypothetical protein
MLILTTAFALSMSAFRQQELDERRASIGVINAGCRWQHDKLVYRHPIAI